MAGLQRQLAILVQRAITPLCLLFLAALALPISSTGQDIDYNEDPDAAKRMTLLLKDFDPHPMVHLAVHEVPRARFPVIDMHNHVNDPGESMARKFRPRKL